MEKRHKTWDIDRNSKYLEIWTFMIKMATHSLTEHSLRPIKNSLEIRLHDYVMNVYG